MTWEEFARTAHGAEVFLSGLVGGIVSWLAGSNDYTIRHAIVMVLGGAFAAEYLTTAILITTGYDLPDRAVGFLVGVLSMRVTDVLVEILERGAKEPKYILDIVYDSVFKRFLGGKK